MKIYPVIISLILLAIGMVGAVAAAPTDSVSSADAIYQVHVTSVTLDPEVFFPYETGTVTVQLANSGNQTVSLSHLNILDTHFKELNDNSLIRLSTRPGKHDDIFVPRESEYP